MKLFGVDLIGAAAGLVVDDVQAVGVVVDAVDAAAEGKLRRQGHLDVLLDARGRAARSFLTAKVRSWAMARSRQRSSSSRPLKPARFCRQLSSRRSSSRSGVRCSSSGRQ